MGEIPMLTCGARTNFKIIHDLIFCISSFVVCIIISLLEVLMALACNVPKVVYCIQRIVSFIVALSL